MLATPIIEYIEGLNFALTITVHSGLSAVIMSLSQNDRVEKLLEMMKTSASIRQFIFDRAVYLLGDFENDHYIHKHDCALLAYLYALSQTDASLTAALTKRLAGVHNLFWVTQYAKYLESI